MKKIISILLLMVPIFLHAQIQLNNQWGFGGSDEDFLIGLNKEDAENILVVDSRSGISGNKTLPSFGSRDAWILKLRQDGAIDKELVLGGSSGDYPEGIAKIGNHYFVAISSASDISGNKTWDDYGTGMARGDFWLVKLDMQFQIVDQWIYGTDTSEMCFGIIPFNNKVLMYGSSMGNSMNDKSENSRGLVDAWVICVDTLGNKIWDKTYGGTSSEYFSQAHILQDGIVFIGKSSSDIGFEKSENSFGGSSDIWVVKTDFSGNKIWDKTYGDFDDEFVSNSKIVGNKLIITGLSFGASIPGNMNLDNKGGFDAFLLSLQLANPSMFHAKSFGGSLNDSFSGIEMVGVNFLVAGVSESTDGDLLGEINVGDTDIWISIIDSNFHLLESVIIASTASDIVIDIKKNSSGFLVACISSGGINGDKTTPNHGLEDVWLLEISHPLSIDNKTPALFFEIYPNPTSDVLYFRELNNQFSTLEIVDIQGRVQHSMQIEGNTGAELSISNLIPGTYIAKLQLKNGMWVSKKFVKL